MQTRCKVMRKACLLLAFLLLLASCYALRYSLGDHYITVDIDEKGYASVTERYYLAFKTQQDIEEFAQKKTELGTNIDEWSKFNPAFGIHIGSKEKLKSLTISLTTANSFIEGTDYVVPEHTFLTFILPAESTVLEEGELFNYATVEKGIRPKVRLRGFLAIGNFNLRYIYWKGIAPQISISFMLKEFVEGSDSKVLLVIFGVLFVAGLFVYFNRKKINEKITNFIVSHTEFSEEEHLLK